MEHYARWLQQVLTTRGMCTRHLDENFERLGRAIAETIDDSAPAVTMLEVARRALRYPEGTPARRVQDAAPELVKSVAAQLYSRHPAWPAEQRARCADDLRYHLAYAADALALAMPSVFAAYITWIGEFFERRKLPRQHLEESISLLRVAVTTELRVVLL